MKARSALLATLALVLLTAPSLATAGDDATSLSYISYLERYATLRPAESGETLEAQINMPVLAGDRLETSRGARVEMVLADGSLLWVDQFTTIDFDAIALSRDLAAERNALYVATGSIVMEIPETVLGEATTRVETPAGVVYLHRGGLYRLDVGNGVHVEARAGLAELPAGLGSALLRGGQEAWIDGEGIQKATLSDTGDDFWTWVAARRTPVAHGETAKYVDARSAGRAAVLDSYGDWVYVNTFSSWMWRPRVSVTWSPYTYGRWYWTPVGWTWISYEPWGWYPSHYGSWYLDAQYGWVWCWDWVWGPAWVHWIYTPGYVGWCPRGYYDWWYWNRYEPHRPYGHRWTRSALDFSGRVRLREIDPRPWTIVTADNFGSTHLDRVRIDARRVLREGSDGREGFVRSGPLVTPGRSATSPSDLFDRSFRSTERTAPGLGSLLGRGGDDGRTTVSLPVRSIDTATLARVPERRDPGSLPGRGIPDTRGGSDPGRGSTSPGVLSRGGDGDGRSPGRRSVTPETQSDEGRSSSRPSSRSSSGSSTSRPSSPPPSSRPSSPPPSSRPSSPPPSSRPSSPPPSSRPSSPPPSSRPDGSGSSTQSGSSSRRPTSGDARNISIVVRGTGVTGVDVATPPTRRSTVSGGQTWLRDWSAGRTPTSPRSARAGSSGSQQDTAARRAVASRRSVPRSTATTSSPTIRSAPRSAPSQSPRFQSGGSTASGGSRSVTPRSSSQGQRPSAAPSRSSSSSSRSSTAKPSSSRSGTSSSRRR